MIELIKKITTLANHLDNKGLVKEADYLDKVAIKIAHEFQEEEEEEGECGEDLGDELYYLKNLSSMNEDAEQENDAYDLVDT